MSGMQPGSYIVAGGSSGLGAACVRRLARDGATGVIADVAAPDAELLTETARRFVYVRTDVASEEQVRAAIEQAQGHAPLAGAIVCAGVLHAEKILGRDTAADLAAFRRVIEINLVGSFNLLRLAAAAMQSHAPDAEGQRGVIVLTSSVAAFEGQIGQAAYSASKGGVASLVLPAARELGRWGIRVVGIAPGVFETPMMQKAPDNVRDSLAAQVPFPQRFGRPEEFADLVVHIMENRMLNGTVVRLDGGMRMGAK